MNIHPKVVAGGAAGAAVTLLVAVLATQGIVLAPAVVGALLVLVQFAASYFKAGPVALPDVPLALSAPDSAFGPGGEPVARH